ncbi:MAG: DMT family transporter [Pseudomonadota bacterium]
MTSIGLVLAAGLFLSTAGIGVRLLEVASGMQIVFYRSLGMGVFLLLVVLARYRAAAVGAFLGMRTASYVAALCFAGASIAVIFALLNTTVANAMFIISLAPFFTAILGWLVLGERVRLRTWLAMAVAAAGVLIMVEGALSGDGLLGMVYALAMALCYAGFSVSIRAGRLGDMTPAICFSGLGLAAVSALWVDPFVLPTQDLLICLGLGVFQAGLGGLLLVFGARGLPAVQVNFLAMLEVVLSPVWVWLVVNEQPAKATLIGGAIILAAISFQALSAGGEAESSDANPDLPR